MISPAMNVILRGPQMWAVPHLNQDCATVLGMDHLVVSALRDYARTRQPRISDYARQLIDQPLDSRASRTRRDRTSRTAT